MEWEHKGITYKISTEELGALVLASARAPHEGPFVRVRPFSAIGTNKEEAVDLLKKQIKQTYKKVPEMLV